MGKAPEWRQDLLTERLVLISPERAERPLHPGPDCPFCEGHESETPSELLAIRDPNSAANGPGWRVRVVPNRFAAVRMNAGKDRSPPPSSPHRNGEGERTPGVGKAEVFIECPSHVTKFRELPRKHVTDVIRTWRDRLRTWRDDSRLAFALVFKNEGQAAGASVDHCHSQLIGIPFVPPDIAKEVAHLTHLQDIAGVCPYCRWVESGRSDERFVTESNRFAVFCPHAPRTPGEMWLVPKLHNSSFDALADDKVSELADVLLDALARMDKAFGTPDFNLMVKSAPFRRHPVFHWRIEVLPRTTSTAGWEWGTGLLINTMFPEDAAKLLR